jgi:Glucose dehydrogenase
MYLSTPSSRVIALDAETGTELWKFDPQANKQPREFNSHRGVAYWEDAATNDRRILSGTVDGKLIELDAKTGKPVESFGANGMVDLRAGGADRFQQDPSGERVSHHRQSYSKTLSSLVGDCRSTRPKDQVEMCALTMCALEN